MSEPLPQENYKIAPHNAVAEQSLLGCLFLNPELIDFIDISSESFYIHKNRWIFDAMKHVKSAGMNIDFITVIDRLKELEQYDQVGWMYISGLPGSEIPDYDNALDYANIIKKDEENRRYLEIANRIAKGALNGGVDVARVIDELVCNTRSKSDGNHISSGLEELRASVLDKMEKPGDVWGIKTGFYDLDNRIGGLHKQQTLLISGDPGVGKTTLMLQIALNAAKSGTGVAIFEIEMDEQRCLRRLIEIECGVTNREMMSGRISKERFDLFEKTRKYLSSLPIFINDNPVITTAEMRGVIARARTQMDIDSVFLDYLGLLDDSAKDESGKWDQEKARRFRAMCREMDLAGVSVQDMTKEGMKAGIPKLADMSGGARVHFGADWAFFLVKDVQDENKYFLAPAKQRDGDNGSKPIQLLRCGLPFKNMIQGSVKGVDYE